MYPYEYETWEHDLVEPELDLEIGQNPPYPPYVPPYPINYPYPGYPPYSPLYPVPYPIPRWGRRRRYYY